MYHGEKGYIENCTKIVNVTRNLAARSIRDRLVLLLCSLSQGIKQIKGLRLCCEPDAGVISWTSDVFNINSLCEPLCDVRTAAT